MRPIRVMVIDDEAAFVGLLRFALEAAGRYEVQVEQDPRHAVAAARAFRPDVALVDILMPEMDGGDVVADFTADPALRDIPIIYLTATVTEPEVEATGGIIGGRPFLAKPVSLAMVMECIDRVLLPSAVRQYA